MASASGEVEPVALGETPTALGSDETEPVPKGSGEAETTSLGSDEMEPAPKGSDETEHKPKGRATQSPWPWGRTRWGP